MFLQFRVLSITRMANPYQSPETESELVRAPTESKSRLGAKIWGVLAMALGLPIVAYGCLILGMVVISWNSISATPVGPEIVLLFGALILSFGAGLSLAGLGLWANRKSWSRTGWLAAILSFIIYVAIVIVVI